MGCHAWCTPAPLLGVSSSVTSSVSSVSAAGFLGVEDCACVIEHGASGPHLQVQMARDILLFAQQRDPVRMRPAYPANAAMLTPGSMGGRA